jgi:hypothetical protein
MLAAAYLSQCTTPDDRLINTMYGADVMAFSRRLFTAGQVNFVRGLYASDAEQRRAIARARAQSAPLAFMEPLPLSASFAQDFPIFGEFLHTEYEDAGTILKGGEPYVRVLKRRNLLPVSTFADTGLPCFQ